MTPLKALRLRAIAEIDRRAEAARQTWITKGDGQAIEYQQTLDEARTVKKTPSAKSDDFPMVAAEARARTDAGMPTTLRQAADAIVDAAATWTAAAAEIKTARRLAKMRIGAATSTLEIAQILRSVTYPTADE